MFIFRGITESGIIVQGDLILNNNKPIILKRIKFDSIKKNVNQHWSIEVPAYEIIPESLSISTGFFDINRIEIYSSFPVNGEMSKGGDVVFIPANMFHIDITGFVVYYNGEFKINSALSGVKRSIDSEQTEIIANQFYKK